MSDKREQKFRAFSLVFSLALFGYMLVRASQFTFTDDEASSLLDILYMNVGYFFGSYVNTHLINTFFLWVEMNIFGYKEFFLRIHSVFAWLLFAWMSYRISIYSDKKILRYLLPLLISLHPFMIDFFSMARGYAISFAFMMGALYYFINYLLHSKSRKNLYISFFCSAVSVVSCYVMLNFHMALLCLYVIGFLYIEKTKINFKNILSFFREEKIFWVVNFIFIVLVAALLIRMNPGSLASGWPAKSFWGDSLYSIVSHFVIREKPFVFIVYLFFMVFIVSALLISCVDLYKSRQLKIHSLMSILFVLIYLSYTLQYHLLDIPFVSKRGIIYLYPVIMLLVYFAFTSDVLTDFARKILGGGIVAGALWLLINFYLNASFTRGILTPPNDVEAALLYLDAVNVQKKELSLGVNASASAPLYYYKLKHQLSWAKDIGMGYSPDKSVYSFYGKVPIHTGTYDYFIIEKRELADVERFQKVKIIREYPETNLVLAKAL